MNPETVRIHSDKVPIIYGDASNIQLLKKLGVEKARMVVIVTSGINMLEPILQSITQLNPKVKILARTHYLLDHSRLRRYEHPTLITSELESMYRVIEEALNEFSPDEKLNEELVTNLRKQFSL